MENYENLNVWPRRCKASQVSSAIFIEAFVGKNVELNSMRLKIFNCGSIYIMFYWNMSRFLFDCVSYDLALSFQHPKIQLLPVHFTFSFCSIESFLGSLSKSLQSLDRDSRNNWQRDVIRECARFWWALIRRSNFMR